MFSCLTLCDPVNCNLLGSSFHEIFQARILDWVAIPFPRESFGPRDQTLSPELQVDSLSSKSPGKPRIYKSFCWKKNVFEHQKITTNHKRGILIIILVLFYEWEDARIWTHWNYSFDRHFNYLGPVSCFSPSWIPIRRHYFGQLLWLIKLWPQHPLFTEMADVILCLL